MLVNGAALVVLVYCGGNLALTLVTYGIIGFTLLAYLPSFWTLPTLVLGGSAAAVAVGFINCVGNLGGFAGPSVFGSLRTGTGANAWSLYVIAGCTLLAGLLSLATVPARLEASASAPVAEPLSSGPH
jgi:nitrate/nitrite transporter NarK